MSVFRLFNLKIMGPANFVQVVGLIFLLGVFLIPFKEARACDSCYQQVKAQITDDGGALPRAVDQIEQYITRQFDLLEQWTINVFWAQNVRPSLALMTEQLTAMAMQQVQIIGSFMDAGQQMETQRLLQKLQAQAHKDYHPSTGMCEFGSTVKSLAASERKAEYAAIVMADRSRDRAMGAKGSAAAAGKIDDVRSRVAQYKTSFCDPMDNNNGLGLLCGTGATNPERKNKDIDFARTVAAPWTLNVDFTDGTPTDHEEEVLALASNLYGHDVFIRPPPGDLAAGDPNNLSELQKAYMDMRAVQAKRSVAENSYNAITGMKARGTAGSREYMIAVLEELGVSPQEAGAILGDQGDNAVDPSYYAQMEILTKKIFQNPDFYTNLYDKPTNVQRKEVALQAIGLMQKFDLFKSYLRQESSLSILLELAVADLQLQVEDKLGGQKQGGKSATGN